MNSAAFVLFVSRRRLLGIAAGCCLALNQIHLAGATLGAPPARTDVANAPRVLAGWKDVRIVKYWWAPHGLMYVLTAVAGGKEPYSTYQIRTGRLLRIAALERPGVAADLEPSPDGRRFLCVDDEGVGDTYWRVIDVNGHELLRRKASEWYVGMRGTWLPDSHGWAEITSAGGRTELRFPLNHPTSRRGPYIMPDGFVVTAFADSRTALLSTTPRYTEGDSAAIRMCRLNEDRSLTLGRVGTFGVAGAVVRSVALSPDGRRLCWLAFEQTSSQPGQAAKLSASLYATTDACTNVREITRIELSTNIHSWIDSDLNHDQTLIPTCLSWAPDGRSVTYLLNGNVWIVAVPGAVRSR